MKSPFVQEVREFAATTSAFVKIELADLFHALGRHAANDWGDVSEATRHENEAALISGGRVYSVYTDRKGVRFSITSVNRRRMPMVEVENDTA